MGFVESRLNLIVVLIFGWFLWIVDVKSIASNLQRSSTYIVHMDKSLMPKAFTSPHTWYSSILDSLKLEHYNSSSPLLIYTYDHALHGFSATLSVQQLQVLNRYVGFVAAYQHQYDSVMLDTTHSPEFLSLTPSFGLWPASNFGEDVVIGVVDSGIWPESSSFKDQGNSTKLVSSHRWKGSCDHGGEYFNSSMCNSKLIGVGFFNEGVKAKTKTSFIQFRDTVRDTTGHGTYCSSIAAGNYASGVSYFGYGQGTAKGVAPRARLAAYKVVWTSEGGESLNDVADIAAGVEKAIADGVDVISLSLSYEPQPLDRDPIAKTSFAAMEKGIFVSTSAGNTGPGFGTLRNGIPWVLTVTAGTTDRWFAGILTLGNGLDIMGWSTFPYYSNNLTALNNLTLVYDRTVSHCNSSRLLSKASSINNAIVICDKGNVHVQITCILSTRNLSGAILIYDNLDPYELRKIPCPCIAINSEEASILIRYVESSERPSASMKFQQTLMHRKPSPVVASYASRGPSRSCPNVLKPDVMAPGSIILGAWIPNRASISVTSFSTNTSTSSGTDQKATNINNEYYDLEFGTSAACPHAAGVAALLKATHPNWSVAAIRSAIMTTANPLDNTGKTIWDSNNNLPATPLAMGAGQIDPNRALDPGLVYDASTQDYVNWLCSVNYTATQIFSITRSFIHNCSTTSTTSPPDLNYPSIIALYDDHSRLTVQNFQRSVTNVGLDFPTTYTVVVIAPKYSLVNVTPQVLAFQRKYDKQSFTVTVKYKGKEDGEVCSGELVWIEDNGNHTVRSPIVISPSVTI